MEWKTTKSDTPNLLCSAEFTSKYPETNEKVFSELMANEMAGEWILEANLKSKKVRIDGVVRVSKKILQKDDNYRLCGSRRLGDTILRIFEKVRYRYFATNFKGSVVVVAITFKLI